MELFTYGNYVIEVTRKDDTVVGGRVWEMPATRPVSEFQIEQGRVGFTASFPFLVRRGLTKAIRRNVRSLV